MIHEALFVYRVIRIWDRDRKRIIEDGARLRKLDAVLPPIGRILSPIPLKSDSIHLLSSLTSRGSRAFNSKRIR